MVIPTVSPKQEIPLAAAVVGLADAWDAMTTERPYHRALDLDEAFAEVRNGRGTQFVPEVVDAFFSVVRKRPERAGRPRRGSGHGGASRRVAKPSLGTTCPGGQVEDGANGEDASLKAVALANAPAFARVAAALGREPPKRVPARTT